MKQNWNTDYSELLQQIQGLLDNETDEIIAMANTAALLYHTIQGLNWLGFYRLKTEANKPTLLLGPFQGKIACTRIPIGKGVCGTSVAQKQTLVIPDVHQFPGHIACDSASNSEIVIPLYDSKGQIRSILDIDSPHYNRFSQQDKEGLEQIVTQIQKIYQ